MFRNYVEPAPPANDEAPRRFSRPIYRKLWPGEGDLLRGHLTRLDREERTFRFGYAVSDERIADYCASTDWLGTVVLAAEIDGTMRAAGELKVIEGSRPSAAELALSVERRFDGHGIGSEIFQRLLVIARNRGIRRIVILCLAENDRMRRIASKAMPALRFLGDQVEGEIALAPLTPLSLGDELYNDCWAALRLLGAAA
ncbi:MAG TPA: GNAT family N-acetyltransferase [Stellaceae bacterium]|nr:GNAT family N-acetyltransferase [Stellaceae bacterium]